MAGLYIHVPFCTSKCAYCDFYSRPITAEPAQQYVRSLLNELSLRRGELSEPISTIYLGGGTPGCLPTPLLLELIGGLPADSGVSEFTIEVNPENITPQFLDLIKRHTPVNRISMGVQSLCDNELSIIGRRHNAATALAAAEAISSAGFNMSLDLIYGLPEQTVASWRQSLSTLLDLRPQHLSCYLLSYEPGTRLSAMKLAGKVEEASEVLATDMYDILTQATASAGYRHYEISNFAIPGFEARHNSSYWNMTPYLGLGPGAHSFDGAVRRFNPSDLRSYLAARGAGITITEEENIAERFNDFIITTLRTADGMDLSRCARMFGPQRSAAVENTAYPLISRGIMWRTGTRIGISEAYWLRSDSIMLEFIEV